MLRSAIRYADDEFRVSTLPAWLDAMDARRAAQGQPPGPRPVGEAPAAPPVTARMNYARWLADCECGSAVLLFRAEPECRWFWDPVCGNATTGGKLRPVLWPADRALIDANKATLPAELAHWQPAQPEPMSSGKR